MRGSSGRRCRTVSMCSKTWATASSRVLCSASRAPSWRSIRATKRKRRRRCGAGDHAHGRDLVAGNTHARLRADGDDVQFVVIGGSEPRSDRMGKKGIETLVGTFVLLGALAIVF